MNTPDEGLFFIMLKWMLHEKNRIFSNLVTNQLFIIKQIYISCIE